VFKYCSPQPYGKGASYSSSSLVRDRAQTNAQQYNRRPEKELYEQPRAPRGAKTPSSWVGTRPTVADGKRRQRRNGRVRYATDPQQKPPERGEKGNGDKRGVYPAEPIKTLTQNFLLQP